MFFLFSKVLFFVLSPLTWLLALTTWALFTKKPKRKRYLLIAILLVAFIFSNRFIINEVLLKWEVHPVTLKPGEKYDYAIVLGGFSSYDTAVHRINLNNAGDRIWQAVELYEQHKVKKIFISGGSGQLLHLDKTEADKVKDALLSFNIPAKNIEMEMTSRNTHENAVNTSTYLTKHYPEATCLLVTSAMHMKRAMGCFKKVKLNVVPYAANQVSEPRKFDFDILFFPDPDAMSHWQYLIKEIIGYFFYSIAGYI